MLLWFLPIFTFYLQSSCPLRYLPSFPTRRSSDLELFGCFLGSFGLDGGTIGAIDPLLIVLHITQDIGQSVPKLEAAGLQRSEEHTSELQSRGHLVCRLLLEKKKTTSKRHVTNDKT